MQDIRTKLFEKHGDERGCLIALEEGKEIPFPIKRIFYIYGVNGDSVRGKHANRRSSFMMICMHGSCRVRITDGAAQDETFLLDSPDKGLFAPPMTWKEMYDFSQDAVLLVLADMHYDAGEYIRNYEDFTAEAKKRRQTDGSER